MSDPNVIEAIVRQIARLRNWYAPRQTPWDKLTPEGQLEMSQEWVDTLAPFGAAAVIDAISIWQDDGNQWFPSLNDIVLLCQTVTSRRQAAITARSPRSTIVHCDGTGWVDEDAGLVPCPRCNPYLRKLYADRPAWRKFLEGTSIHVLLPELRFVQGKLTTPEGEMMPEPCQIVPDEHDSLPTFEEGIEIAQRAYVAEAVRMGTPVDLKRFNATVGMIRT